MPAEKSIELLEEKLKKHSFDLRNDITAIMKDGASILNKVGRLLVANQQLSFACGTQLQ